MRGAFFVTAKKMSAHNGGYKKSLGTGEWQVIGFDNFGMAHIHCRGSNGFQKSGIRRTSDEVKSLLDHDEGALHGLVKEAMSECRTCGHEPMIILDKVEPRCIKEHDAMQEAIGKGNWK